MRVKGHPFFDRLDQMLDRRNMFRKEIAPLLGCTDSNISQMYSRGALPDIDRCLAVAKYLKCSPGWLAWDKGLWEEITEQEKELVTAIKEVPDDARDSLMQLMAHLTPDKKEKSASLSKAPKTLMDQTIDAL